MKTYLLTAVILFGCAGLAQDKFQSDTNFNLDNDTLKRKKQTLKEIEIREKKQKKFVSAVRSGLKPMDNPQSLQTVSNEIIAQQQSVRLSDVVKNANGVYVGSARGGAQESFWSRGYDMGANNIFKNGFRQNGGSMPEVISLEKVEFLKGSSALLYGNVAPGGIMNLVTKTPLFERGGEISFQTGSYDFYKPVLDFYGPLNNTVAYRFVGSTEKSKSFREVVERERYYVNPSFLFKVSKKTDILIQGDYLYDNWTPDFGTGAFGKTILDVPINRYLGAKWSNGQTRQAAVSTLIKHTFNENWKLTANVSFQDFSRQTEGTDRIQPKNEQGDLIRFLGKNRSEETIFGQQLALEGHFKTFGIKHQLFTGADGEINYNDSYGYVFMNRNANGSFKIVTNYDDAPINIFNPATLVNEKGPLDYYMGSINKSFGKRYGFFAQDLITLHKKLKVLAGLRWSWQETDAKVYKALTKPSIEGNPKSDPILVYEADQDANPVENPKLKAQAFSPKLGVVFQPVTQVSIFGSYSNSFTPNNGVDIFDEPLKPSIINQFEVGLKTEFIKNKLAVNVTTYLIDNNNLVQMASHDKNGSINTNTNVKALSGQTKSKGIEVDITTKLFEGFNINAGYSHNDMRFVKTSGRTGSAIEGDRLARTPDHTANLSFFYTVQNGILKNISLGAIGNYVGNRIGGWNNQYKENTTTKVLEIVEREIPVSDYTTVDATIGYTWKNITLLCKVSNITNTLNYTVHENYSINPIAPRQFMANLKYKF